MVPLRSTKICIKLFPQWQTRLSKLGDNLTALILGGGYGRGEGGVILVDGAEMPYNDLDLTLMVGRKSKIPWTSLQSVGNTFAKEFHIHVDFSRPLTIQDVEKWPNWLMWHDLVNGHVVLKGPSDILISHAPLAVREQLPTIEGTRLLLNRGAGLLWALKIVRNSEKEPDNSFYKAQLLQMRTGSGSTRY